MNLKLFEFALLGIKRHRGKNIFIFITFTLLISLSLTIFTITGAIRQEAMYSLNNLPDILVQKLRGGRQQYIQSSSADQMIMLPGVKSAVPRVWGFYPYEYLNTNLTIVGVDIFDPAVSSTLAEIISDIRPDQLKAGNIFTGEKFRNTVREIYNRDEFSFQKPDGTYITLKIAGIFKTESAMLSAGTIISDIPIAAAILGIPEGYAADIAVSSSNNQEISTIAEKISNFAPDYKVITKDIIRASYQNMFDFKGGVFLLFFLSSLFTFFMIIFDRISGLSGDEIRETAILRAIGWSTPDVLKVKLYEALVIAVTAFAASIFISLFYVYILQAPGIRDIFMGYSYLKPSFRLTFSFDLSVLTTVFFITVPVYCASVIIPSWRASVADAGEVIR